MVMMRVRERLWKKEKSIYEVMCEDEGKGEIVEERKKYIRGYVCG